MLFLPVEPEAVVEHRLSPELQLRMQVVAEARAENQIRVRQVMVQRMVVAVVRVAVELVALQPRRSPVHQLLQATPAQQDLVVVAVQVDIAIGQLMELLLLRPQVVRVVRELLWCVTRCRVFPHQILMQQMT